MTGSSAPRPVTEVAVGIVFREDGAVLIGQRLAGKPYAGWWEFPGGKFEPGEDAAGALARELDEELGIRVLASQPWVVREHVYEHAHVRLHFRRVVRWAGEVVSREGQAFVWCPPTAIDVGPLLPAALAPIAWLGLPRQYAVSDAAALGSETFLARLADRLQAGSRTGSQAGDGGPLRLLQLREPEMAPDEFDALFPRVLDLARAAGARVLVSSRHERRCWEQAAEATGGGVHLTGRDLEAFARGGGRPDLPLVGASCHRPTDLELAGRLSADLAVFGPVETTASRPGAAAIGWEALERAIGLTPVPVYALGGLAESDLGEAMRRGAHGVALAVR